MVRKLKKCSKCQKEIITGKFYSFYIGKKGGRTIVNHSVRKDNKFFCPLCTSKEKVSPDNPHAGWENFLEIEWEVGNQTDEEIIEFEEKWIKCHSHENEFTNPDHATDDKKILAWCQKVKQELEPYLQKPKIVEKSFGGKLENYGNEAMAFYYLFAKSAQEENYRKEVVEPTIAEILGVAKLNQEINTTIQGSGGKVKGTLEIDNQQKVDYSWFSADGFRRIYLEVFDQKLALQSFYRALKIKEKELKGDNSPNQPEQNNPKPPSKNNNMEPDRKKIKQYFLRNDIRFVKLYSDTGLMICHENRKEGVEWRENKSELSIEEKEIQNYLKKQGKEDLTRQDIEAWTDIETSKPVKNSPSNPTNWTLIIGLFIAGIILLGGLIFFLRTKKRKPKIK